MLHRSLLCCASLATALLANAQAPAILWQNCLGGSGTENAQTLIATSDGGYLALSMTTSTNGDVTGSHGDSDIWLTKLDDSGVLQWQRALGGSLNDTPLEVVENDMNEYIVLGLTLSNDGDVSGNHGGVDLWIVKLDATGNLLWQRCLGGSGNEYLESIWTGELVPHTLLPTPDGGCIVSGSTSSSDGDVVGSHGGIFDIWMAKVDGAGMLEWQLPIGGTDREEPFVLIACADGGYIIAGFTSSNDGDVVGWFPAYDNGPLADAFVVKVDAGGTLEWSRTLGGDSPEMVQCVRQTADGGFILASYASTETGEVSNIVGGGDWWLVKLDATGDMEWDNALGGPANEGTCLGVEQTPDGGYMAFGVTRSADGGDVQGYHGTLWDWEGDYWVVKTDPMGEVEWQHCLGGTALEDLHTYRITPDGGCIVGGWAWSADGDVTGNHGSSDAWVVKLDDVGSIQWKRALGGSGYEGARSIVPSNDGGFVVLSTTASSNGNVSGAHGDTDTWCVKLAAIGVGVHETTTIDFAISPVPATSTVQVTTAAAGSIFLRDALGREVLHASMSGTTHMLDVADLPRGMYTITLRGKTGGRTHCLVLE